MTNRPGLVRGTIRAAVGLVITGVAATSVLLLSTGPVVEIERAPLDVRVETEQAGEQRLVCAGPFGELGADASQPDLAVPVGSIAVTEAVDPDADAEVVQGALTPGNGSSQGPETFVTETGVAVAAAQLQSVNTATVRGTAATTCAEPANSQWLVGGATTLGVTTTVTIGNPGAVTATVHLTVHDEAGVIDSLESAGVIVAPGAQQTVSINGFAPDRARLAVHVASTGAPVTAALSVAEISNLDPYAISGVTRQVSPAESVVIPAVTHRDVSGRSEAASDAADSDELPVLVRAIAADGAEGSARILAVNAAGESTEVGQLELAADAVAEFSVVRWPADAHAVVIEADVAVYASARGAALDRGIQDYEWFSAAPVIRAGASVAVPRVAGGELVLTNTGDEPAEVSFTAIGSGAAPKTVTVPGGGAVPVKLAGSVLLESSGDVYGAVRVYGKSLLAGYPVLPEADPSGELTVFLR